MGAISFNYYQHDRLDSFRFVLLGDLSGVFVRELENAWKTADSVLDGKPLIVDLSKLNSTDDPGMALLVKMRAAGANFVPDADPALLRTTPPQPKREKPAGLWTRLFSRCPQ